MCVPPKGDASGDFAKEKAKLDSLREIRCPRLMSSAAEYYRNRDWKQTIRIYSEITRLDCDEWNTIDAPPEEIYQYYSIAYEQLYERLMDLAPEDVTVLNDLAKIYKDQGRFVDQILVLEEILNIDQNNEIAQSELAMAFESSGRDPLDIYQKRYDDNPDNISYGLDYADRLINADHSSDAVNVLNKVISKDPSGKLAYRKLVEASILIDDLENAAKAYESLFKIDPRDGKVAILISDVYIDLQEFGKALRWSDKAISLISNNGDGYGQKGKVYYIGWDSFRQNPFSTDDRIVAKLAYDYFLKAEEKGYRGYTKQNWLEKNAKDVLYGKAQWFMADDKVKRSRTLRTSTADYNWVTDILKPETSW